MRSGGAYPLHQSFTQSGTHEEIVRPRIELPARECHPEYMRNPVPPEMIVPEISLTTFFGLPINPLKSGVSERGNGIQHFLHPVLVVRMDNQNPETEFVSFHLHALRVIDMKVDTEGGRKLRR